MQTSVRYPIGEFHRPSSVSKEVVQQAIAEIQSLPKQVRDAVIPLTAEQLDTPYRPEGWTIRQVVHHLPDSHLNGYTRLKLALTEEKPTIRTYEEALWAELPDSQKDVALSLSLLAALHSRWVTLLTQLGKSDLSRSLQHPEAGVMQVSELILLYAWHGRHHLAHITSAIDTFGW